MKRSLLISAMIILTGFSYAQSIIPKAGLTIARIGGDMVDGVKSKSGFMLGVGFNIPVNEDLFSIQPELNFIQKGYRVEGDDDTKATLSYIEIPVLLKATYGKVTKFYMNAGPSIGFGLGGKAKWDDGELDIKFGDGLNTTTVNYIENGTDIGLQLGCGVIIVEKIMIDARYGAGLTKLDDDSSAKNNVLQFTVGVPLGMK